MIMIKVTNELIEEESQAVKDFKRNMIIDVMNSINKLALDVLNQNAENIISLEKEIETIEKEELPEDEYNYVDVSAYGDIKQKWIRGALKKDERTI